MLNKDQILQAKDLPTETVEVPEWGGSVIVKTMTGTERDAYESSIVKGKKVDMTNIRAKLCAICIVDDNGERLFTDRDVVALSKKSAKALDRIFDVAQKLNGLGKADVEELEKNSGQIQTDSSTSD